MRIEFENKKMIYMIPITLTETSEHCYDKAVGVSNPSVIPDYQITASSQYSDNYQPFYGRLNGDRGEGWCAKEANRIDDWLQIDFGKTIEVCAVATQGDRNGNEWVTDFKISFSSHGISWNPYKASNGAEVVSLDIFSKGLRAVSATAEFSLLLDILLHFFRCLR